MGERTDELSGRTSASSTEDRKRSDQIRQDIHRTQREIGNTVDDLQYRLSPDRLRHEATDYLRSAPERASRGLMDKIRENPVPAAIAGLGLWMFFRSGNEGRTYGSSSFRSDSPRYGYGYGSSSRYGNGYDGLSDYDDGRGVIGTAKEKLSEVGDRISDAADTAREKTSEAMHNIGDRTSEAVHNLGDKADYVRFQAKNQAGRARAEFWDVLDGNPLALGAAGVAIGALLDAALPVTEKENELMGDVRDRFVDKAKDVASEGVDRAKEVARAATEAGKDEAKHQADSMTGEAKSGQGMSASSGTSSTGSGVTGTTSQATSGSSSRGGSASSTAGPASGSTGGTRGRTR